MSDYFSLLFRLPNNTKWGSMSRVQLILFDQESDVLPLITAHSADTSLLENTTSTVTYDIKGLANAICERFLNGKLIINVKNEVKSKLHFNLL